MTAPTTSPSTDPAVRKRVPVLDGIRGICALGVLLTHTSFAAGAIGSGPTPPGNKIGGFLGGGGTVILGPFFILSGLLLYRPWARNSLMGTPKPKLGKFFRRRALRLLPAFYLLTAVCLLLLNFNSINSVWYVLRPVTLMHNYDPNWMAGMDTTWTVPTETQFYLALPILALAMHWLAKSTDDPGQKIRRMMIPPIALVLVGFFWTWYIHTPHMGPYPPEYFWPFAQSGLFGVGMIMAVVYVRAQAEPDRKPALFQAAARWPNLFWLGAVVLYLINCAQPYGRAGYGDYLGVRAALIQYVLFLGFSFLVVAPLYVPNAASRFQEAALGNPVVRYLGRISYGIYLWHFAIMYFWFQSGSMFGEGPLPIPLLLGRAGFIELATAVVVGSIAVATVSYYVLERPALRLAEWTRTPRKPDPVVTTGVPSSATV